MLTSNHLAFLEALCDRPESTAASYRDLFRAVAAYLPDKSEDILKKRVQTVPHSLMSRGRVGSRTECALTPRGVDVLEGRAAAWIVGKGRYEGRR